MKVLLKCIFYSDSPWHAECHKFKSTRRQKGSDIESTWVS